MQMPYDFGWIRMMQWGGGGSSSVVEARKPDLRLIHGGKSEFVALAASADFDHLSVYERSVAKWYASYGIAYTPSIKQAA